MFFSAFGCVMFFPAVWIFSEKRAYATQTDIKFVAVTEVLNPLYFHWRFEDGPEIKTTSRIFKKRYRLPNKCFCFFSKSIFILTRFQLQKTCFIQILLN